MRAEGVSRLGDKSCYSWWRIADELSLFKRSIAVRLPLFAAESAMKNNRCQMVSGSVRIPSCC